MPPRLAYATLERARRSATAWGALRLPEGCDPDWFVAIQLHPHVQRRTPETVSGLLAHVL